MQSQSITDQTARDKAGCDEMTERFSFKIMFGEICLYEKIFSGHTVKPNIFDGDSASKTENLIRSPNTHVISAPCTSEQQVGIHTSDHRLIYTYEIFGRMSVKCEGDYQGYLGKFRKKSLNSLKRKIKKVEKSNSKMPSVREFTRCEDVQEFVAIAKPISAQSYQEAQLGTVFRTDADWISELESLARANRFRGYVLYVEDRPVAYNYCPVYGDGVLLYDLSGYLPASSSYSPGTVLQDYIIKHSFADESIKTYDLCSGGGRHKEQFATDSIRCFNAFVFPDTAYYRMLCLVHLWVNKVSGNVVAFMERLGIKDKIKTYLRRRGR